MRKKFIVFWVLICTLLTSCGGGGPVALTQQIASTVSRSILMGCLSAPTSPDALLLGCLSGKVSLGRDAAGNECKAGFSADRLNLLAKDFSRDVTYQRVSGTGNTSYVYDRSYSESTGALYFGATANHAGAPYFSFSFSTNTISGGGAAQFEFKLAPDIPGAPGVLVQCTMQL